MNSRASSFLRAARTSRRRLFSLGLLWVMLATAPAFANERFGMVQPDRWQPHTKVGILDHVRLRMHWYDDLDALRAAAISRKVDAIGLRGFSILTREAGTGEWVCDVFMVRMRGALVDKERTVTFGHELMHCFGFRHE